MFHISYLSLYLFYLENITRKNYRIYTHLLSRKLIHTHARSIHQHVPNAKQCMLNLEFTWQSKKMSMQIVYLKGLHA
jgi:hypothetical protein